MPSPRIEAAEDAESEAIFILPFGAAFLKVLAWQCADDDYFVENIRQVDLFADKACTKLIAEDIEWQRIEDQGGFFLEIRSAAFRREEAQRRLKAEMDRDLANALRLTPVFDSIFGRIGS